MIPFLDFSETVVSCSRSSWFTSSWDGYWLLRSFRTTGDWSSSRIPR